MAAGSRYGLAAMSASRSSMRGAPLGTRTSAERLFPAHVAAVGDQVAPEVVDLQSKEKGGVRGLLLSRLPWLHVPVLRG
jgi:hypothetical protein